MSDIKLPLLPECDSYCTYSDSHEYDVWNAGAMQVYARAAVLADRAARADTVTVPEGYALVPVEPDDDMIEKGCAEHECDQGDPWYSAPELSEGDCKRIYAAMIAAAPTQERGADDE